MIPTRLSAFSTSNFLLFHLLIILDIKSHCTVILHSYGFLALQYILDRCLDTTPCTPPFFASQKLCPQSNALRLQGKLACRILGPGFANGFVRYVEAQVFSLFSGPIPELYGCHIDDCVGCPVLFDDSFPISSPSYSTCIFFLIFQSTILDTSINISLYIDPSSQSHTTSTFFKPTDSHLYLNVFTTHHSHTKRVILYSQFLSSQFLHLRRMRSRDQVFKT